MAQDYYCILTNAGLAYEAACKANQVPIKLTHFAVGDGNGAAYNPGPDATALRRETHRQAINSLLQDEANPSWLLAEAMIADDVGGWTIREVGIYTDTGLLYAIGKYPDSVKPVLAQGSGKQFYVRAIFQTSNATSVTLLIDNSVVMATRAFVLEQLQAELGKRDAKNSVKVATTANLGALSGLLTVDGVLLGAGDRVLVKDQADGKTNGIYVVAAGTWARATDADASIEVTPGLLVTVEQGAANADSIWQLVTDAPITLGTESLAFEIAAGPSGVVTGTYRSVTVDKRGRVTGGSNPTTLAGYGITDAVSASAGASQVEAEAGTESGKWMSPLRVFQAIRSAAVNATELLRGVLRVGTQAEVNAGVLDDVAITPKKLRWGFAVSLAANGYIVFPTWLGGLVLQWGRYAGGAHGPTVAFPIVFPTACFLVVPGPNDDNDSVAVQAPTTSGFGATQLDGTGGTNASSAFYWLALGH